MAEIDWELFVALYIILISVIFGGYLLTRGKKNLKFSHNACKSCLMLYIPIIPIIMLVRSLLTNRRNLDKDR